TRVHRDVDRDLVGTADPRQRRRTDDRRLGRLRDLALLPAARARLTEGTPHGRPLRLGRLRVPARRRGVPAPPPRSRRPAGAREHGRDLRALPDAQARARRMGADLAPRPGRSAARRGALMGLITLTDPVAGTVITAGLHANNNAALRTAINGGLDNNN